MIDFLSWHINQPEQSAWKESYDPQSLFASVCAAPLDFEEIIHRVAKQIDLSQGKGRITQCIDEWNIWLPPGEKATSMHQVTFTMRDSLYIAGVLNVLFKNANLVDIANLAQLVNVLPLIKTDSHSAFATSIYYPFVLAAEMEEHIISTSITSPSFDSEKIGENVTSHQNVPYLDIAASQSDDEETITLLILNRHPENRMHLELSFTGDDKFSQTECKVIKAASPLAFNSFNHPDRIRIYDEKRA